MQTLSPTKPTEYSDIARRALSLSAIISHPLLSRVPTATWHAADWQQAANNASVALTYQRSLRLWFTLDHKLQIQRPCSPCRAGLGVPLIVAIRFTGFLRTTPLHRVSCTYVRYHRKVSSLYYSVSQSCNPGTVLTLLSPT